MRRHTSRMASSPQLPAMGASRLGDTASVESFIDVGEGTIPDVLQIAEEKHWLRSYTKLADILQQALAAARFVARAEAGEEYGSEDDLSDDDVEAFSAKFTSLCGNQWARNIFSANDSTH